MTSAPPTLLRDWRAWIIWLPLLLMAIGKILFAAFRADLGVDGAYFIDVAQHVRDGHGLMSDIDMYHMGFAELPHPTSVYPLWPLLLGLVARLVPMRIAAVALPSLLSTLALYLAFLWGRRQAPQPLAPRWLLQLHGGHLMLWLFGLNLAFFRAGTLPYTEALAYTLLFATLLRLGRLFEDRPWYAGLELGVWLALMILTRSQLVLVAMALCCTLAWDLLRGRARAWVLSTALLACISAALVLWPQVARTASFTEGHAIASLLRFDLARPNQLLSHFPFMVETHGPLDYLLDRLKGLPVAFGFSRSSYSAVFFAFMFTLPLAALWGVVSERKRVARLWPGLKQLASEKLFILALAIGSFVALHSVHKAYFSPWHFDRRHALPVLFLVFLASRYLLRASNRRVVAATALILWLGAAQGGLTTLHRGGAEAIAALRGHPELAAQRQLAEWLRQRVAQQPRAVIGFTRQEAQRLAWQVPGIKARWIYETTQLSDLDVMVHRLGLDYLVLKKSQHLQERLFDENTPWQFLRDPEQFTLRFEPLPVALEGHLVFVPRKGEKIQATEDSSDDVVAED